MDSIVGMTIQKLALTFEEAAEASGYSIRTLRTAVRNHDLIARYANSKAVIRVSELDEWLAALPTEPAGGHRPVSQYGQDGAEPAYERTDLRADESERTSANALLDGPAQPLFRTPEQAALELGLSKSTVRQYCRTSGIFTRIGRRVMLHEDDVQRLVAWIRENQGNPDEWWKPEQDPFA